MHISEQDQVIATEDSIIWIQAAPIAEVTTDIHGFWNSAKAMFWSALFGAAAMAGAIKWLM